MSETTQTQAVKVFGPNIRFKHGATFEVHDAGCRDASRGPCALDRFPTEFSARSLVEICDEIYDPDNFHCESGDYLFDFHFAPCVHLPVSL